MKLIKKDQGEAKQAGRHFGQCGISRISPETGSHRLKVSLSHFLPKGGTEMYASSTERVYFGVSGSLRVVDKEGGIYDIEPGDVLYLPPGEEREITNVTNEPATILVIIVNID